MSCVDCQKEVKGTFIRCFPCNKKNKENKTVVCSRCSKLIKDNGFKKCYDCNMETKKKDNDPFIE